MEKKAHKRNVLAIMMIYLLANTHTATNSILQILLEEFPNASRAQVTMVSTLPSLMGMFTMLVIGVISGRKVKYKTTVIFGMICYTVGGVMPFFFNSSIGMILLARAIFGIGIGSFICRSPLIISACEGQERARYMGLGVTLSNGASMLMILLTGFVSKISWKATFLEYFIGLAALLIVLLFMIEPEKVEKKQEVKRKGSLPGIVFIYALMCGFATVLVYPFNTNMASLIQERGLGTAASASIVLSAFTLGGAVGGMLFGKVYSMAKKYVVTVIASIAVAGMLLVVFGKSIPLMFVGMFLVGAGFFQSVPMFGMWTGIVVKGPAVTTASSINGACVQLCMFASGFWASFAGAVTGNVLVGPMYAAIGLYALAGILFAFIDPRPKESK